MGLGPSKEKIRKILERSITNPNMNEQKNLKIEYKFNLKESLEAEENSTNMTNAVSNDNSENDSFYFSTDLTMTLNNPKLNVKNTKKFPYITIGTISVTFPEFKEVFEYTCFLIDTNVVVTLASNIDSKSKGGRASSIVTSFSNEKVKWENVFIQGEDYAKDKGKKDKDKTKKESIDNISSKLAVILYDENISTEWIGVEGGKLEDFNGREINAVFSLGSESQTSTTTDGGEDTKNKKAEGKFREILVNNSNPFLDANKKGEPADQELIKHSPGSPIYYKDYNSGAYVIAIINDSYEFQFFDNEDNIVQLDLQRNDFGPLDIKYLTDFDLKNLRILDLSSNSIKPQGAFYLSQGKFNSLESLNLNFNEIGDEGLNHIANGFFSKLNSLYLFHDNISHEGIKHLVKAEFVSNLIILSLSENPNIGDTGVRYMKEHKGWAKLSILNLNYTGLTDIALTYLGEASLPKLKKLNIQGNKFTETGKASINALRMNHIHVSYRTEAERQKEKAEREKNMKKNKNN